MPTEPTDRDAAATDCGTPPETGQDRPGIVGRAWRWASARGRRRPMTLRACLLRSLGLPLAFVAFVCSYLLTSQVIGPLVIASGPGEYVVRPAGPADQPPAAAGDATRTLTDIETARTLSEQHRCWSDQAPPGAATGAVVVTGPHTDGPVYRRGKMVGLALDQVFYGADHGLTVHAFCR